MKRTLLAASALALSLAPAAFAVDAKLYGMVSKGMMVYDDGADTEFNVVDDNFNSTRFGFAAEQGLDNGLTASALFEVDMNSNPSSVLTQNTAANQSHTPTSNTPSLTERVARVGLSHEGWGSLFLGQQVLANDDANGHDLAAANSIINSDVATWGGGLRFKNSVGGFVTTGIGTSNIGALAMGNNGNTSIGDAIRYDSFSWNGLNGSVSIAQGGDTAATLRYANTFGDFQVDGAIGNNWNNDDATTNTDFADDTMEASVSVKHASGIAGTLAYAKQNVEHATAGVEDPSMWYAKVGYGWDKYGVAVDYANFEDTITTTATDHEMSVWGLGGDCQLADGVSAGVGYRSYTLDVTGVSNEEDVNVLLANMIVKF